MELYRSIKKSRLPWFLFYAGLTIELLIVIVDKSNYINPIEGQLFRVTFMLFALKLLLTDYSVKEWCVVALLEVVALVSYRTTGANDLIRLVTFVAACKNIPLRQMLRYTFWVTLAGCAAIIVLSVTGIYGDISLTQIYRHYGYNPQDAANYIGSEMDPVTEIRYTLGMGHPNALACMFFMLVVLGVYIWFGKIKWYVYLLIMLLNLGVYVLTGSKTGMLITSVFITGACILEYSKKLREKTFIYICGFFVFALCIGFSVDAAVSAQRVREAHWNDFFLGHDENDIHIAILARIDEVLTGRIVTLTDSTYNEGMVETWSAFSKPGNMEYYFDMGWVKLFYRYGVVPGVLYIFVQLVLLWKLCKRKDACGLLAFTMLAVYTVIEAHLISVYLGRNYLLMIMGYYLTSEDLEQDDMRNGLKY